MAEEAYAISRSVSTCIERLTISERWVAEDGNRGDYVCVRTLFLLYIERGMRNSL